MPVAAVFALILIGVPILEIWVIIQVGQVIGAWPTVALLLLESAIGAWLLRREGRRTWQALRSSGRSSLMPGRELLDGALVLVGGTLLLTPGFVTDIVGFFLVLPVTRPLARRLVTLLLVRRIGGWGLLLPFAGGVGRGRRFPPPTSARVVESEVVTDLPPDSREPGP